MALGFAADASDYLTLPGGSGGQVLNPESGAFSAAAWIRVNSITGADTACGRMSDNGGFDDRWSFHFAGSYLQFWILQANGLGAAAVSTTDFSAVDPDDWYHVVGTCSASSGAGSGDLKIYVNGTLEHTNSISSYPHDGLSPADFFVGRTAGAGGRPWDGDIAEVSFWKGPVLTADEVTALWRGVSPLMLGRPATNHWPLWGVGSPEVFLAGGLNLDVVGSPTVLDVHAPVGPPVSQALAQFPGTA